MEPRLDLYPNIERQSIARQCRLLEDLRLRRRAQPIRPVPSPFLPECSSARQASRSSSRRNRRRPRILRSPTTPDQSKLGRRRRSAASFSRAPGAIQASSPIRAATGRTRGSACAPCAVEAEANNRKVKGLPGSIRAGKRTNTRRPFVLAGESIRDVPRDRLGFVLQEQTIGNPSFCEIDRQLEQSSARLAKRFGPPVALSRRQFAIPFTSATTSGLGLRNVNSAAGPG